MSDGIKLYHLEPSALCTGIPIDKVEEMLENLVIAVESESQIVDIGRVSVFMQKVRDGII